MKTIFTLLLSTIFSLASMAYDGTRLTVTSVSNNKMFVEVDGRRYNLDAHTVTIRNIRPGVHNVRVLREVKRKKGWNIDIWSKKEDVIYSIKATLRNGYHFDIVVNRFGKVMIDERRIDLNDDWYDDDDYYDNDDRDRDWDDNPVNRDDKDWDTNRNDRDNRGYDNDRDDRNDKNDKTDRDDDYDDNYSRSMSAQDFNMAKESLRKEWFENTRMTTAKQVIDRNNFTSQQVKELVLLFTFENNRLEIAKYAYGKTVDKEDYFIVNDAFTFNSNKEKLSEYIRDYK
jgi:hypothetical protein